METARWVEARDSCEVETEVTTTRDSLLLDSNSSIWMVSCSRVARASCIQSSKFERRIKASNEEVGWTELVGAFGGKVADSGIESSSGMSVKLVYMPSERWKTIQFSGRG